MLTRRLALTATALAIAAVSGSTTAVAQPALPAAPLPVIADVTAKPEGAATIRAALIQAAASARTEPGCLSYVLYEDREHPGHFLTYETWTDGAALDAHLDSPGMRAGIAALTPLLERPPVITRLKQP